MARLIFSFDSEDYETPAGDDAELWWARTLSRHGLTGCFCVVGELARALRSRGRQDVLSAWQEHEIAFHSDLHSCHPTHAEYLEELSWQDGLARVLAEEGGGIADVRELTGQFPSAYCKPGNSWGPQVAAAMPRLGIPVFCDAPLEWSTGRPMWYCGSLCIRYHHHFDGYFRDPENRLARMRQDLERKLEAAGDGVVVMYTHPCRLATSAFPDNFTAGKNPPRGEWQPSSLRPPAERAALEADFDAFLRWVAQDLRPEITTYRELYRAHDPGPARWLGPDELRTLATRMAAVPEPITWNEGWLSPTEQWSVLVGAVAAADAERDAVAERRLLGPIESPPTLAEAVPVSSATLLNAARTALEFCDRTGRMPSTIQLNGATVGPNAFLQACARRLRSAPGDLRSNEPRIEPSDETPALARRDDFQRLRYRNTWSIFPPEFEGRRLLEWARLQAWTAKPA